MGGRGGPLLKLILDPQEKDRKEFEARLTREREEFRETQTRERTLADRLVLFSPRKTIIIGVDLENRGCPRSNFLTCI